MDLSDLKPDTKYHTAYNINGFIVLLYHNPNAKTFYSESYINNGNIDEVKENMGISHLLEHVCTDGWKRCNKDCSELWKKKGAIMNASTGQTYVNYYIYGLKEYAYDLIDYILSITTNPVINMRLTQKEKAAVINELLIHTQNPQLDAFQQINDNLFTIEGLKLQDNVQLQIDNLKNLNYNKLKEWVDRYYCSGNIVFSFVGDLSEKKSNPNRKSKIIKFINKKLDKFKEKPSRPYVNNIFKPGMKVSYINNKKIENTTIYFSFHMPLFLKDIESYYIDFFKMFINSSMTSLLMYELREKSKLIYNIHIDNYILSYGNYITIEISTKNKFIEKVIEKTIQIFKKIKRGNFPNKHIEYVKKAYLVKTYNTNKNNAWISNWYAEQYLNQLNTNTESVIICHNKILDKIKSMTKKQFIDFVNKLLLFENFKIVYNGKRQVPGLEKKVLKWVNKK